MSETCFDERLDLGPVIPVALDATARRGPLVPGVLGEGAWWSPSILRRLHAALGLVVGAARAVASDGLRR